MNEFTAETMQKYAYTSFFIRIFEWRVVIEVRNIKS